MDIGFLKINNGEMVKIKDIPIISFDKFCEKILFVTSNEAYIVQFFAYKDEDKNIYFVIVLRHDDELIAAMTDAPLEYHSLTLACEQFHMFEREIAEQYEIKPKGHPWLKPVRYNNEDCKFYSIEGEEIHEVGVGPVHAGVIEPGHFRFNCIGEKVLHLEIQLGYQHRGIEKLLKTAQFNRLPVIVEGTAGDTTIGNSLCFAQAFESLLSVKTDNGIKILRTIALELERISNHLGDLGALSGDVAFLPPAAYFGRMRGDFLNMLLLLSGNRFGKGLIRPGRIRCKFTQDTRKTLINRIKEIKPQIEHVGNMLLNTSSVIARFEQTGIVTNESAKKIGLVGVAARASNIPYDVRKYFPTEYYNNIQINTCLEISSDVYARAKVRFCEVLESIRIIQLLLENNINISSDNIEFKTLSTSSFVVTLNEAWRGELSHCIITDSNGNILRYKIKDPSFHNWTGLAIALRNEGISDFPLCNKSFNLSYCGFDL